MDNIDDLPPVSWKALNAYYHRKQPNEALAKICGFNLGDSTVVDLGTENSGAKLIGAVTENFPEYITLKSGRQVRFECLEQRDMYAGRLLGGVEHPDVPMQKAIDKMQRRWEWCRGHIVVLPPTLYVGYLPLKLPKGMVNGQCAVLPPVECVAILRSAPIQPSHDCSVVAVLWYQSGFGIDPLALRQLSGLDWDGLAYSAQY